VCVVIDYVVVVHRCDICLCGRAVIGQPKRCSCIAGVKCSGVSMEFLVTGYVLNTHDVI
jgi:hypothetical protein